MATPTDRALAQHRMIHSTLHMLRFCYLCLGWGLGSRALRQRPIPPLPVLVSSTFSTDQDGMQHPTSACPASCSGGPGWRPMTWSFRRRPTKPLFSTDQDGRQHPTSACPASCSGGPWRRFMNCPLRRRPTKPLSVLFSSSSSAGGRQRSLPACPPAPTRCSGGHGWRPMASRTLLQKFVPTT